MNEERRAIEIDLHAITSKTELHERLAEALQFPACYGRNWDAFWDLITEDNRMTLHLRLIGWDTLQQRLPRDAALLRSCLDDLRTQFPARTCDVIYG